MLLPRLSCHRCGHEWHPRKSSAPLTCPNCRNRYWHRPRRDSRKPIPGVPATPVVTQDSPQVHAPTSLRCGNPRCHRLGVCICPRHV